MEKSKFDELMFDVSQKKLEGKSDELISRMAEVLEEEKMGTLDDMMTELGNYLESKDKLKDYLSDDGTMQIPLEAVFSWFSTSISKKRDGLR